jgi:hypothetical protein
MWLSGLVLAFVSAVKYMFRERGSSRKEWNWATIKVYFRNP